MQTLDAGLRRAEELGERNADPLPVILIWSAAGGLVIWALAIWKLLEILGLSS